PMDASSGEVMARVNITAEQRRQQASQWRATNKTIPPPLMHRPKGPLVSSEFFVVGSYIFGVPVDQDASYNDQRMLFESAARLALPDLLNLVTDLPKLPQSVRDLMRSHSQRLLSYTLPSD
ncbi:MAG TPA: hypothetical protein VJX67_20310, partial [Blastocatellia bacterium]|nr:hypothetical protein [Blastocatellia bacterium]